MPVKSLLIILLVVAGCKSNPIPPEAALKKLGPNPYFEIDGKEVAQSDLNSYDASDMANATTYFDKDAVKQFGKKAKDGAVIFQTKSFATARFVETFRSFSPEYDKMINQTGQSEIQYVLNDRILRENFEGDLALIDRKTLKELKVIDQKELSERFHVEDKKVGVVIRANKPKDLYNADKKF